MAEEGNGRYREEAKVLPAREALSLILTADGRGVRDDEASARGEEAIDDWGFESGADRRAAEL